MKQYIRSLWQPVDNSQLVVFRILFGIIAAAECITDLASGWVKIIYITTGHNFTFIGFEWLQILHGDKMYFYFCFMSLCGLCVAAGFMYRYSSFLLALLWTGFYLSQKTLYNNHYYLILLLCWIMFFIPANRRFSIDVKLKLVKPLNECYRWQIHIFIFQIACVYIFSGIAKLNYDWLHAIPLKVWMSNKAGLPVIGRFMRNAIVPWLIAYGGLLFDLLVVPGLLYKKTRKCFFILSVGFHLLNGYLFKIGSFPYLAISLNIFFFSPYLFIKIISYSQQKISLPAINGKQKKMVFFLLACYAVIQLFLPLRHWLISGPVNWTEEGYRMSWRMMLRAKSGSAFFKVVNKKNDSTWLVYPSAFLNASQVHSVAVLPDVAWQAAQYLKEKYNKTGMDVAIYAHNVVSLNFKSPRLLIDTLCDLTSVKWRVLGHNKWILLY